jgi:phosphoesterase RecJ-like protein
MKTALRRAAALLQQSERPLLISHPRPDGDTIGSTLALRLALRELGKDPIIACVHPLGENLAYLPGADEYQETLPDEIDIDLVVVIDMSDLDRTGGLYREEWRDRIPLLVIDHHATNDAFGDVNLVDPTAAATVMPMIELLEALDVEIRGELATCLLVGLLTDTRGLRTQSTSPTVLRTVGSLIEAGGDYMTVMQKTLDSIPYKKMRGWGKALDRLQINGAVAWTTFPLDEKEMLAISDHADLDLGNLLSRVAEANITAAFVEMRDETVKISFRARPGYDVATVAASLGGGGHRLAAGCTLDGSLDAVVDRVLPMLHRAVESAE